jgi:hypothetical protein
MSQEDSLTLVFSLTLPYLFLVVAQRLNYFGIWHRCRRWLGYERYAVV